MAKLKITQVLAYYYKYWLFFAIIPVFIDSFYRYFAVEQGYLISTFRVIIFLYNLTRLIILMCKSIIWGGNQIFKNL